MLDAAKENGHRPTVSVVVPAYNASAHIAATLQSVLAQTFRDFEIIVVDDCSGDNTAQIVLEYAKVDSRIRLIRLDRNFGAPAGPRNIGVQNARGQWVAFLDADDLWHPDKLKIQLDVIGRTGARFCSSKMVDFRAECDLVFRPVQYYKISEVSFSSQLLKFRTPTSSVVVETELIKRHPFNEDPRYKAREDLDCWLHCHEEIRHSVKVLSPLIGYRQSSEQISRSKLTMARRHYYVLKQYTFRSGRKLGELALVFTFTHFLFSIYYRLMWKEL